MLQALGDPLSLLLLLAGGLLALTLQGWVSCVLAVRAGDSRPRAERRTVPDPRRHLDPFGAVGALIAGVGWAKPLEPPARRRKGSLALVLLTGPLLCIALGLGLLVVFSVLAGAGLGASSGYARVLVLGVDAPLAERAPLLIGLSLLFHGALSLVPLPPLPGGYLLFGLAPRTPGWQKGEYQLIERNIGIAVLLALLLIPLGGSQPLLPALLDTALAPLVSLVTGGL